MHSDYVIVICHKLSGALIIVLSCLYNTSDSSSFTYRLAIINYAFFYKFGIKNRFFISSKSHGISTKAIDGHWKVEIIQGLIIITNTKHFILVLPTRRI